MQKRSLADSLILIRNLLPDVDVSGMESRMLASITADMVVRSIISKSKGLYPVTGDEGKEIFSVCLNQAKNMLEKDTDRDDEDNAALENANSIAALFIPTAIETVVDESEIEDEISEPVVVMKDRRGRKQNPNSNVNRAKALYAASADKTRENIIQRFVNELGIKEKTAMTYYYIAKDQPQTIAA